MVTAVAVCLSCVVTCCISSLCSPVPNCFEWLVLVLELPNVIAIVKTGCGKARSQALPVLCTLI